MGTRISERQPSEVTGWTVLIWIVAFFAVVAGVNAVMIRAAVSTFGGIETENAYQAGLAFEREIATAAAQDALHWDVQGRVTSAAGLTKVEVIAADAAGAPLRGLTATARLVHPTDRRIDHVIALSEREPGKFIGATEAVVGQWALVVELAREGTRMFRSRNRLYLR